jgi:release factor glutamine methyltransferase
MPEVAVPLRSLIGKSAEHLRRAGIPEPRRQALRIWTELSGTSLGEAVLQGHAPVVPSRAAQFQQAIGRRARGEPLPHITGWAGFRHLSLRSDRRALIPRPETEGLVELVLQRVRTGTIADVGTGSGCIALSLAIEGAFNRVVGVDCSAAAIALAQLNSQLLGTPSAVAFVRADLCQALRWGSFDALISNPPYLTLGEYAALDESVREWEPALALRSGADGLEATTRLIDEGRAVLQPRGWLALEVDCTRAVTAAQLAREHGWQNVSIHVDLFGRERYLLAQRSDTR